MSTFSTRRRQRGDEALKTVSPLTAKERLTKGKTSFRNNRSPAADVVRAAQMRRRQSLQQTEAHRAAPAEEQRCRTDLAGMDRSIEDEFSPSS